MTRAERRRLEKLTGCKQAVYQYTAAQIDGIKRQAVQEQKQYLDKVIDEEWKKRTEASIRGNRRGAHEESPWPSAIGASPYPV